jgi:hypothetical protein
LPRSLERVIRLDEVDILTVTDSYAHEIGIIQSPVKQSVRDAGVREVDAGATVRLR